MEAVVMRERIHVISVVSSGETVCGRKFAGHSRFDLKPEFDIADICMQCVRVLQATVVFTEDCEPAPGRFIPVGTEAILAGSEERGTWVNGIIRFSEEFAAVWLMGTRTWSVAPQYFSVKGE